VEAENVFRLCARTHAHTHTHTHNVDILANTVNLSVNYTICQ